MPNLPDSHFSTCFKFPSAHLLEWEKISSPGLSADSLEITSLARLIHRKLAALEYKCSRQFLLVMFIGGTGTGKSTLFNAVAGKRISRAGVERPKTCGPLAYAHSATAMHEHFPLTLDIDRISAGSADTFDVAGAPGRLTLIEHLDDELAHLVLVDTPDVDSIELSNRLVTDDFFLLSDFLVFVASQEKYADDVPFRYLRRAHMECRPFSVILNKAESPTAALDALKSLVAQGLNFQDNIFRSIPFLSNADKCLETSSEFHEFKMTILSTLSRENATRMLSRERDRATAELGHEMSRLGTLLERDDVATRKWLQHLDTILDSTCRALVDEQRSDFATQGREHVQREIRQFYNRYDVLGRPRRFIARIMLSPLKLLGFDFAPRQISREETLVKIRQRFDPGPVQNALHAFCRSVLDNPAAESSSELYECLRKPEMVLSTGDVRQMVWDEQEKLILWLEKTFAELSAGIPRHKELGIYSASILWGSLILAFELIVQFPGVYSAVLDPAIAPFVTRGTVEMFAYTEVQKITAELGRRYEDGLIAVLKAQRDRYADCLRSLRTPDNVVESIKAAGSEFSRGI